MCTSTESGGFRCENAVPGHGDAEHWVSDHTVLHALAGNGYACSAIAELHGSGSAHAATPGHAATNTDRTTEMEQP